MITRILKTTALVIFLLVVFFLMTFPFERVGPKIARLIEQSLVQMSAGPPPRCEVQGFGLSFPFGVGMEKLRCDAGGTEALLEARDVKITGLPFSQSVAMKLGTGSLALHTNISPFSFRPTQVRAELSKVPLAVLTPFFPAILRFLNPSATAFITGLKLDGALSGKLEIPFTPIFRSDGLVDLRFEEFRLPNQGLLDMIGLREIRFTTAVARMSLKQGRLEISEFAFLSESLSAKAGGQFKFEENFDASSGAIELKWQVVASDALRASLVGPQLLNAECPNPDSQRFCTRRLTRPSDFAQLFRN